MTTCGIHFHLILALFESVENNQVETLKSILEKDGSPLINTLNNDGFSALDIAVLLDYHQIIKALLQHGAKVGLDPNESIETHLNVLLSTSEQKFGQLASTALTSSTGLTLEHEKEKSSYEKRIKLLRKMLIGWAALRIPDSPFSFSIGL